MTLIIAQCSKSKKAGDVIGMDKYNTRTHNLIREFMLDGGYQAGWDWMIMSAGRGLVAATETVSDYDAEIVSQSDATDWVARFAEVIEGKTDDHDNVLFIGSNLYRYALELALGRKVQHIGKGGRGCGDYYSALKEGLAMYSEDA